MLIGIALTALTSLLLALMLGPVARWLAGERGPLTDRDRSSLSANERLEAVNNARHTLLQAVTGLVVIGGVVFTGQGLWYTAQTLNSARQSQATTEQGQITDRYTKAVEQLGSGTIDVRLGGIYALERLAKDSPRDHSTIYDVLAAFVREHDPATEAAQPVQPASDVQAALTVLSRRDTTHDRQGRISLAGVRVSGAALAGGNLSRVDLSFADLSNADLTGADLSGADLNTASLSGTLLTEANLSGADLAGTDLTSAALQGAQLTHAQLSGARMTEADLPKARLTGAGLSWTTLTRADLTNATLTHADMRFAQLRSAKLANAKLDGADLCGAALKDADLRGANLTGANMRNITGPATAAIQAVATTDGTTLFGSFGSDRTQQGLVNYCYGDHH
ncbi:hypothetical protein GCM10009733_032680 [Nonomuraea maheshkhaliensis]|uniref:Pentapeptide repeat-containing protein n=1 Tax=Nonomuraea maheshkhaliensis TaxID=419590 RepID=A0ABN2F7T7_9ACTN